MYSVRELVRLGAELACNHCVGAGCPMSDPKKVNALRRSIDQAPEPQLLVDATGHVVHCNPPAQRLFGYSETEICGCRLQVLVSRVGGAAAKADNPHDGRNDASPALMAHRRDGQKLMVDLARSQLDQGLLLYTVQESRGDSAPMSPSPTEDQLQRFIDSAPVAIAMFDRAMRYIAASARWMQAYELSGDIIGRSHYDVFPEIPERWKAVHRRALAGETVSCDDDSFVRADGSVHFERWEVLPWRDASGAVGGVVIATEDITKRIRAERTAEDERRRLRTLIETIPDLVWLKDPEGRYLACNPAFERMVGISEEALVGKTDYEIVDRSLADFFRHMDREAIAAGRPMVNEEEIVAGPNGTRATLRTIKTPMFGTDGKLIGVLGVGHDITSMLQARQTLVESEQKYRTLVDSMGDGVFVAQDFQFVFANQAFASMLGRSIEEAIGLGFPEVVDEEFLELWTTRFRQRIGTGPDPMRFYEVRFRRKDGTTLWIELRASRSIFNGKPAVLGIVRDITDRRQAEAALRESEARFLKVFRANPAATCISRLDTGEIIDVNEAMLAMVGYSRDEMCGSTTTNLGLWVNPEDRQRVVDALHQHGRQEAIEIDYRCKSGEQRTCIFSGERIEIGGRQYLCSYATDITEQKRAAAERERLRAQLEQAQKMEAIGQVTGGVAHDFNNILAIILGYTDMLASSHLSGSDPAVSEYIGNIRHSAERGRELISKMMLFSRNQESKVTTVVSLVGAIEEVVAMLGPMISASIDVRSEIDDNVEPVLGGLVEVEQVLMNLSINARDAMEGKGRLSIRLERARRYQSVCSSCRTDIDGHFVSLSITDSGTGISEDTIRRMFDPFFTTKAVGHGTGLGLSMVHGILHRFGGHVIVASTPGMGTTFRLLFVPASTQDLASALRPAPVATDVPPAPAGGRIMVVDDEPQLCKLMTLILRKQGYDVVGHTDPQAALAELSAAPDRFDAIITDQTMPGMSGTALAEAIRELRPHVPIILCSGFTERSQADTTGSGPIDLHLEKPVSAATLTANVGRLLAARRGTAH